MKTKNIIRKTTIVSVAAIAIGAASMTNVGHSYAAGHSSTGDKMQLFLQESNVVHPAAAGDGTDGAKGGNVEFEWKVEEGESLIKPIGLTSEQSTVDAGKKGNVEYEWKVEEGELNRRGSSFAAPAPDDAEGDEHEIEYDIVAAK